jgi:hypothetical protein
MLPWDIWLKDECNEKGWKCHIRCKYSKYDNGRMYYTKITGWTKPNDLLSIVKLIQETRRRALCGSGEGARITSGWLPGSVTFRLNP